MNVRSCKYLKWFIIKNLGKWSIADATSDEVKDIEMKVHCFNTIIDVLQPENDDIYITKNEMVKQLKNWLIGTRSWTDIKIWCVNRNISMSNITYEQIKNVIITLESKRNDMKTYQNKIKLPRYYVQYGNNKRNNRQRKKIQCWKHNVHNIEVSKQIRNQNGCRQNSNPRFKYTFKSRQNGYQANLKSRFKSKFESNQSKNGERVNSRSKYESRKHIFVCAKAQPTSKAKNGYNSNRINNNEQSKVKVYNDLNHITRMMEN